MSALICVSLTRVKLSTIVSGPKLTFVTPVKSDPDIRQPDSALTCRCGIHIRNQGNLKGGEALFLTSTGFHRHPPWPCSNSGSWSETDQAGGEGPMLSFTPAAIGCKASGCCAPLEGYRHAARRASAMISPFNITEVVARLLASRVVTVVAPAW